MNAIRHDSQTMNGRPSGFTLVEVLLSIGILGVGMAMVAAIFPVAAKEAQDSNNIVLGGIMCDNALGIAKSALSAGQKDSGTVTTISSSSWSDTAVSPAVNYPATVITDTSKTWPVNSLEAVVGGYLAGCYLEIYGPPWSSTTAYAQFATVVYNGSTYIATNANTGQRPDQNPASWSAGMVESGRIVTNTANSVTIVGVLNPMPGVGALYRIIQPRAPADSGFATGVGALGNTFTDAAKFWSANQWAGWSCYFRGGIDNANLGVFYLISPIPLQTRYEMQHAYPPIAHTDEGINLSPGQTIKITGAVTSAYQLVLLADENQNRNVINPITLHYPCGFDSSIPTPGNSTTANGTSRGCVLMTTKPLSNDLSYTDAGKVFIPAVCHQPSNMSSADGSLIIAVAYSKSVRSNLAAWGGVMVTSITNTATNNGLVPVVTINPATAICNGSVAAGSATLCVGSPLVLVETGQIAKILQVPAIGTNGTALGSAVQPYTTAVLDTLLPMPRGAAPALGLVVQEIQNPVSPPGAPSSNGLYGPFTGTVLPISPAIAWKVSQTGAR